MAAARQTNGAQPARTAKRRRATALSIVVGLALSLLGFVLASPAQAETNPAFPNTAIRKDQVWNVYVASGEGLIVNIQKALDDGPTGGTFDDNGRLTVTAPNGATFRCFVFRGPQAPAGTNCRQADGTQLPVLTSGTPGIWQVKFDYVEDANFTGPGVVRPGEQKDLYYWLIAAVSNPTAPLNLLAVIPGRVWVPETTAYAFITLIPLGLGTVDLNFFFVGEQGAIYQNQYRGYNGVDSAIAASAIGLRTDGTCIGINASVEQEELLGPVDLPTLPFLPQCANGYKLFFEAPNADLPVSAQRSDGVQLVKPPLVTPTLGPLTFTPTTPGARAGNFTVDIQNFQGSFDLRIDTNNDGDFTDATDRTIPAFTDANTIAFDGIDGLGNPIPSTQAFTAEVRISKAQEIHFLRGDVEQNANAGQNNGIEVIRVNGPTAGDSTIYWDDRRLNPAESCEPMPPPLTSGLAADGTLLGTPSLGGVHGWPTACGFNQPIHSYGDQRVIEDFTFQPLNLVETVTVGAAALPGISLVKSVTPPTYDSAGDVATYSFVVTNTGNVALTAVNIVEGAFSGTGTPISATCPAGAASLAPAASVTCTATYAVTAADVTAGSVTNTATASGTPPTGPAVVSAPDTAVITAVAAPAPAITLVKSVSSATFAAAGDVLTYSFLVTNTGNVTLTGVTVNETAFSGTGPLTVTCPAGAASLAPAASVTCTAPYTITAADVTAGEVTNAATATGTPPDGPAVVSDPDDAIVTGPPGPDPTPGISLVKSVTPATYDSAGDVATYSFVVTNTGNVALTDVNIVEGAFSGTGTPITATCPAGAASLAPAASVTCTATYAVTTADVTAGSVTNTATASGTPPTGPAVVSAPDTAVITAVAAPAPAITLVKSVSSATFAAAGDVLTYSFLVTNTGNVTLTGVTVDETAFSGTGSLTVTCPAGAASLAPAASVTCTATYTITAADVTAGEVTNAATATGTPPTGPAVVSDPDDAIVTGPPGPDPTPGISIVKSVSSATFAAAGDVLTYSFVVTNTGNVTLTDVTVNETDFSGTGGPLTVTCPAGAASLAPGASVTCTAPYTITAADVTAGEVTNAATATGTTPGGPVVVSDPDDATVTGPPGPAPTPSLTIVKSATPTTYDSAGDVITYSFVVTNTGNVTLVNVVVTELAFSGTGGPLTITCPAGAASLAPAASVTCTATYTVTAADVRAGSITNVATATGATPSGATVTAVTPSTAKVRVKMMAPPAPPPPPRLPVTGVAFVAEMVSGGLALVLLGGALLIGVRRRRA